MKSVLKKVMELTLGKAFALTLLVQGLFVQVAFAQWDNVGGGSSSSSGGGSIHFDNPLGANSLGGFIDSLLGLLVQLSVPVIALFIIYAGFLMVTARGNEGQLEKAKKTLLYTMIGAAIVLGARVISGIITGTLLSL